MPSYRFRDTTLEPTSPFFQAALEDARGAKLNPACLCTPAGALMYIIKFNGVHYIKRMPNTGPQHDVACEHYDPPPELSGLGEVMGTAIKEDVESGTTALRFNFALSKAPGRAPPVASDKEQDSVKTESSKLTLTSLLHYLWDGAGLTHWQSGWTARRSWGGVQRQLLIAALGKQAKGLPLAEMLYIPAAFFVEKKDELAQQRNAFIARLQQSDSPRARRLGVVIAEVKALEAARYGYKLVFKHVPDYSFMLSEDALKLVKKRFQNELGLWEAFETTHLVAIATFEVDATGLARIEEIAVMITTETWIPFVDLHEKNLLDRLVADGRHFIKGLRYNMSAKRPLASVELTDTKPAPTVMFVVPANANEDYKTALQELTDKSRFTPWVWDVAAAMPALPLSGSSRPKK